MPNRTSEICDSPSKDLNDDVYKIIDCSKLDDDELNLSGKMDDVLVEENVVNTNGNNNEEYSSDFVEEEENLTVIVPEELNKIDEIIKDVPVNVENKLAIQSQVNLSEKFKQINSKIPNYFLPQEDMEKSMKKLHYNYTEV